MRKLLAVALVFTSALISPAHAQQQPPTPPVVVAADEAPIPVEPDAPAGSSGPRSIASGTAAGVVIVLGVIVLTSVAFLP